MSSTSSVLSESSSRICNTAERIDSTLQYKLSRVTTETVSSNDRNSTELRQNVFTHCITAHKVSGHNRPETFFSQHCHPERQPKPVCRYTSNQTSRSTVILSISEGSFNIKSIYHRCQRIWAPHPNGHTTS